MKWIALAIVLVALIGSSATATDDLGTPDPLNAACQGAIQAAAASGLTITRCRTEGGEFAPTSPNVYTQKLLLIADDGQRFHINVLMTKSLWSINGFTQG